MRVSSSTIFMRSSTVAARDMPAPSSIYRTTTATSQTAFWHDTCRRLVTTAADQGCVMRVRPTLGTVIFRSQHVRAMHIASIAAVWYFRHMVNHALSTRENGVSTQVGHTLPDIRLHNWPVRETADQILYGDTFSPSTTSCIFSWLRSRKLSIKSPSIKPLQSCTTLRSVLNSRQVAIRSRSQLIINNSNHNNHNHNNKRW